MSYLMFEPQAMLDAALCQARAASSMSATAGITSRTRVAKAVNKGASNAATTMATALTCSGD
eukprot:11511851-Alexandrium_andersonii.AAC.1